MQGHLILHSLRRWLPSWGSRSAGAVQSYVTEEEDAVYANRFDLDTLTYRLTAATQWLSAQPHAGACRMGYFGASTGAAAALQAAAALGPPIGAVVSRGGRPDLVAQATLQHVQAPTLLIVGERDPLVLELNQRAYAHLPADKRLVIIPGATHLFEEPGALQEVARLAAQWFTRYLQPQPTEGANTEEVSGGT